MGEERESKSRRVADGPAEALSSEGGRGIDRVAVREVVKDTKTASRKFSGTVKRKSKREGKGKARTLI